jgi:hypothetical protein
LANLVPQGVHAGKSQPVNDPILMLRGSEGPFAVLLITPHQAYIRSIAATDVEINGVSCAGRELVSGDRVGLGSLEYQFQREVPLIANGHARAEAFLISGGSENVYPICQPIVLIGRGAGADVRLGTDQDGAGIVVVIELPDGHALVSLTSPPGFQINGQSRARHRLVEGDVIQLGEDCIRYSMHRPAPEGGNNGPAPSVEAGSETEIVPPGEPVEAKEGFAIGMAPRVMPEVVSGAGRGAQKMGRELDHSGGLSNKLSAWGPLAQAVISGQMLPEFDEVEGAEKGELPRGRRWWLVMVVLAILIGAGCAAAWWVLRHR